MKFNCPVDGRELKAKTKYDGMVHGCSHCGGEMLNISVLKKNPELKRTAQEFWDLSKESMDSPDVVCPGCDGKMKRVYHKESNETVYLCRHCHLVWLTNGQYDSLPRHEPVSEQVALHANLSKKSVEALLRAERNIHREIEDTVDQEPPPMPKHIPEAFAMFPTDNEGVGEDRVPWVTWSLIGVFVIVILVALSGLRRNVLMYGFKSADPFRMYGLTIFTSFFLQRNFLYFFANAYFLKLFGDKVERKFGHLRVLLLLGVGHLAGLLLITLVNLGARGVSTGIDAGVTAMMAYYVMLFPTEKFRFILRSRFHKRTPTIKERLLGRRALYRFSAYWSLLLWIFIQLLLRSIARYLLIKNFSLVPMVGGLICGLVWGYIARVMQDEDAREAGELHIRY